MPAVVFYTTQIFIEICLTMNYIHLVTALMGITCLVYGDTTTDITNSTDTFDNTDNMNKTDLWIAGLLPMTGK